jgi:hypothetical protein
VDLTENEMMRLRLEDGFATSEDERKASDAGIDWASDRRFRGLVRNALLPTKFTPFADQVMARLGEASIPIGDAIGDEAAPSVVGEVMNAIGGGERWSAGLAEELRFEAGEPAPIWGSISDAVGGSASPDIGSLLRDGVAAEGDFKARGWLTPTKRWAIGGAAAAVFAAAAALLLSVGTGTGTVSEMATAAMTPILDAPVEIEALEVGAANLVQVLQFGQDSPTIIFVSDDTEEAQ